MSRGSDSVGLQLGGEDLARPSAESSASNIDHKFVAPMDANSNYGAVPTAYPYERDHSFNERDRLYVSSRLFPASPRIQRKRSHTPLLLCYSPIR